MVPQVPGAQRDRPLPNPRAKKYLGSNMIESRIHVLQHFGIMYSNDKCYDTQLEVIINAWSLVAGKILFLVIFDYYGIKY